MREMSDTASFESLNRLARRSLEEKSSCNAGEWGSSRRSCLTWCQTSASALSSNIKPGRIGQQTVRKESMHGDGQHTSTNPIPKQLAEYFAREDTLQNETPRSASRTQRRRPEMVDARGSARECRRSTLLSQTQTNMDYRQPLEEGRPG